METTVAVKAPFLVMPSVTSNHRCTQRKGGVLGTAFRNHCRSGETAAGKSTWGKKGWLTAAL